MKRKIAAIMAADVVGYSKLMADDEEGTLVRLQSSREVFNEFVSRYGGRIFNTAGDSVLAEFASAVEAVRCALEIQECLRTKNLGVPEDLQMQFRLGINIGDIVERDGDLLGDGVNIAARLEAIATPGGICVSRAVYEQVENKLAVGFADMGPQNVKNLPNPIHAYVVDAQVPRRTRPPARPGMQPPNIGIAGLAALALASLGGLWLILAREPTRSANVPTPTPVAAIRPPAPTAVNPPPPAAPIVQTPPAVSAEPLAPAPAAPASPAASVTPSPAPTAPVSAAFDFDVAMSCDKLPWTVGPLHQLASVRVQGGQVEFTRIIRDPKGSGQVIGTEIGKGTYDRNGRMVIDSTWGGRNNYTVRYEGTVTAKGGTMRGDQKWIFDGQSHVRPCSLVLTRK